MHLRQQVYPSCCSTMSLWLPCRVARLCRAKYCNSNCNCFFQHPYTTIIDPFLAASPPLTHPPTHPQILSILEELHKQKYYALQRRHHIRSTSTGGGAPGACSLLQYVPEGQHRCCRTSSSSSGSISEWLRTSLWQHDGGYGSDAAMAAMAAAKRAHGSSDSYRLAVGVVSGVLEHLLWTDSWDAAAPTQLLELLLLVCCRSGRSCGWVGVVGRGRGRGSGWRSRPARFGRRG